MSETYWEIEEWVPPIHAIGGKGYWHALSEGRFSDFDLARQAWRSASEQGRRVRMIEVRRLVLWETTD